MFNFSLIHLQVPSLANIQANEFQQRQYHQLFKLLHPVCRALQSKAVNSIYKFAKKRHTRISRSIKKSIQESFDFHLNHGLNVTKERKKITFVCIRSDIIYRIFSERGFY